MYKQDLALNNLKGLICHDTELTYLKGINSWIMLQFLCKYLFYGVEFLASHHLVLNSEIFILLDKLPYQSKVIHFILQFI